MLSDGCNGNKKPASADEKCYMAGVEGFEPPHDGTRTRCLTTWRHPIAVDTVAQAGVVFKLFAPELIGFIVLPTNLLSCRSFEEWWLVARQTSSLASHAK